MRPLSVLCPAGQTLRLPLTALSLLALAACASEPVADSDALASAEVAPHSQPKPVCSAPPPVQDIWKLEPLLSKQGLITADMSAEQKEAAIRQYIRKKNEAFLINCQEKK